MEAPRQAVIVLDLDGTLVDSLPDLAGALNRLLASRALSAIETPAIAHMVGDGAASLVKRGFAHHGRTPDEAALPDFLADYTEHATVASRPYPGARETIGELRSDGYRLAVCTNKPQAATDAMLASLGLADAFDAVVGGDAHPFRKPDPRHLLAAIEQAGGHPARAVMVGDHANDMAAAKGAGAIAIFAAWGYGVRPEGQHDAAQHFCEIPALAKTLLRAGNRLKRLATALDRGARWPV